MLYFAKICWIIYLYTLFFHLPITYKNNLPTLMHINASNAYLKLYLFILTYFSFSLPFISPVFELNFYQKGPKIFIFPPECNFNITNIIYWGKFGKQQLGILACFCPSCLLCVCENLPKTCVGKIQNLFP